MLSVANNQRILHHFLFGKDTEFQDVEISKRSKTYFPHRTKTSFRYKVGKDVELEMNNIQIEIDVTIECKGTIGVFEGKNGSPDSLVFIKFIIHFCIIIMQITKMNLKEKLKIYFVFML